MQKLAEVCIKRPIFAAMIVLALVVVGAASYFRLGVDRFPSVDLPTVRIQTILPGASPEEIETQVSQRIEEAVNTVEGINELRSISGQGRSFVNRHLQSGTRHRHRCAGCPRSRRHHPAGPAARNRSTAHLQIQ